MNYLEILPSVDIVYQLIGGFILIVFMLRRELLDQGKGFVFVLTVSSCLFLIGLCGQFIGDRHTGSLLTPLISLCLYRLLRQAFCRRFGYTPRDTLFIWNPGLAKDRAFNILYGLLAMGIWILISSIS